MAPSFFGQVTTEFFDFDTAKHTIRQHRHRSRKSLIPGIGGMGGSSFQGGRAAPAGANQALYQENVLISS